VLRFEPRGVIVEKVEWRYGTAVTQPTGTTWAMVRISRAP